MSWIQKLKQNWKGGAAGTLLSVGLGLFLLLSRFSWGQDLVHASYDMLFRSRPLYIPQDLVLIYMDEVSHQDLEQRYDRPWNRDLYARLLDRLTLEKARAVAFDILFTDANTDHLDGDEHFAKAIAANGKVVLGAEYRLQPDGEMKLLTALQQFKDVAAAYDGFVQLKPDQDFLVRKSMHYPPERVDGILIGDSYSSMPWELAALVGSEFARNPSNRFVETWLNYYGPPGALPNFSFVDALNTNRCPIGTFSNKIVFVGANIKSVFSGERKDELRTPYHAESFGPAMDVQATQALNLIRNDWIVRLKPRIEIAAVIVAGLLFGFGLPAARPIFAVVIAAGGMLLIAFTARFLFNHDRIWTPWLIIVAAQIPIALLWSVVFNSVQLYVQNRLFQQSLSMYLSPKLVKKFSSDKDLLKVGAKKQMLTILFTDIANFTSISENVEGDQLATHMNQYFQSAVSNCIHFTDGTIVKYIGDAIFAFWNAPDGQIDHAMRGCEAALRFRDQPPQYINGQLLVTRIGLHTGEANVGNFGSTSRVDYTAIGENINLASRMEGLNKHLGTEVLITGSAHEGIAGRLVTRFLGTFQLKGFEKAVPVFELAGQLDQLEKLRPLHEAFAGAVELFQQKKLSETEAAFRRILETYPKDGPTKFYLKFLTELQEHPLPEDWNGEIELKEK